MGEAPVFLVPNNNSPYSTLDGVICQVRRSIWTGWLCLTKLRSGNDSDTILYLNNEIIEKNCWKALCFLPWHWLGSLTQNIKGPHGKVHKVHACISKEPPQPVSQVQISPKSSCCPAHRWYDALHPFRLGEFPLFTIHPVILQLGEVWKSPNNQLTFSPTLGSTVSTMVVGHMQCTVSDLW